jgi:hypothetical protein
VSGEVSPRRVKTPIRVTAAHKEEENIMLAKKTNADTQRKPRPPPDLSAADSYRVVSASAGGMNR